MRQYFHLIIFMAAALWSLSSCEGVMGDLYDDAASAQTSTYGFLTKSDGTNPGRVYLNCTEYGRWMYINFHNCTVDSATISDNMTEPADWDIALHRYDVKTNGGAVMATSFTELSDLLASGRMPSGSFTEDNQNDSVTYDMSHMMEGNVGYYHTNVNRVLRWVVLDMSTMPPGYNPNYNVFIIRLKDGTYAAVKLVSYRNNASQTGHMTFDYIYPLSLNQ